MGQENRCAAGTALGAAVRKFDSEHSRQSPELLATHKGGK